MSTKIKTLGKNTSWVMLESQCSQLLLVLAVRIHHFDRLCPGHCTDPRILEASNAALDQDRSVCHDEHDHVISNCHNHQRNLLAFVHGHDRSMYEVS